VSATLLGFASAVSALAGTTVGWTEVWSAASAILPAISTVLADGNPDGLSITQLEFRPQPAISSGEYLTHGSPSLAPTTLIL
jgi:hypothetical protein